MRLDTFDKQIEDFAKRNKANISIQRALVSAPCGIRELIHEVVQSAILTEREECAKICEMFVAPDLVREFKKKADNELYVLANDLAKKYIAERIRARSQSVPQDEKIRAYHPPGYQIFTEPDKDAPQSPNQPQESPKISFAGIQPG